MTKRTQNIKLSNNRKSKAAIAKILRKAINLEKPHLAHIKAQEKNGLKKYMSNSKIAKFTHKKGVNYDITTIEKKRLKRQITIEIKKDKANMRKSLKTPKNAQKQAYLKANQAKVITQYLPFK